MVQICFSEKISLFFPAQISSQLTQPKYREYRLDDKVIVYLDSNDYSTLSRTDPDEHIQAMRSALLSLSDKPNLIFTFSGAHISEMAPVESQYADASVRRTSLLVDLCGRNTMISFDRLIKSELERLITQNPEPVLATSSNGEWFPELGSLMTPVDNLDIERSLQRSANDENLNRRGRRALKSTMVKRNGKLRTDVEKKIGRLDLSETLKLYPMRPIDARVLTDFVLGKASKADADQAFLESLRDPSFMAKWFIEHHEKLGAVGRWVRAPGKSIVSAMQVSLIQWHIQIENMGEEDRRETQNSLSRTHWLKAQNEHVLSIVNRLMSGLFPDSSQCFDIRAVDKYCPGIMMCLRTLYSSMRNSFGVNPRTILDSDFVDAMHAMYVPYVSFFRADRYMASIIAPLAKSHDTRVFAKLDQLVEALQQSE